MNMIFRNGERISKSERIEIKKKKLHIHKSSSEDNGVYTCQARNEIGPSPQGDSFPLTIPSNETATIKTIPQSVIAKRGEPAFFHCAYENVDVVQWFFGKNGPLESDDEKIVYENGTLVVQATEHRNQGMYLCHGLRGETLQTYSAELQIACEYIPHDQMLIRLCLS